MLRLITVILLLLTIASLANAQLFQSRKQNSPVARVSRGTENEFTLPDATLARGRRHNDDNEDSDASEDDSAPAPMCPVTLSSSFELIRAVNNYRLTHNLPAINISRSLMSTSCAHTRDIATSKHTTINDDCGLHSWSSCCYPSDHSNPNCMHRKALQVTTALKWNLFNVASYELAYEWSGGEFSSVRAMDMFVSNEAHREFVLQQGSWSDFQWRSIGASVGQGTAYIWFGAITDPNGDFDQFSVEGHVMELPGCTCGAPVEWRPAPTLSPAQQAEEDKKKALAQMPMMYSVEQGPVEKLELSLQAPSNNTMSAGNGTNSDGESSSSSSTSSTSSAESSSNSADATVGGISLGDFLKGLLE